MATTKKFTVLERDFIFRIWDKKSKKFTMTGSLYGCEGLAHLSQSFNRSEHVIQQYIGITDDNGVKIFEGDILFIDETFHRARKEKVFVQYINDIHHVGFYLIDKNNVSYPINSSRPLKVVGHIYE